MINEEGFERFYKKYRFVLARIAQKYNIPIDDIDDIVQETYISYFTHYPIDWDEAKIKVVLTKIIQNKCVDYFREHKEVLSISELSDNIYNKIQNNDPLEVITNTEHLKEINKNIFELRKNYQEIIILYAIEGKSIEEICETLGLSKAACYTRLCRARIALLKINTKKGIFKITVIFL